MTQVGGHPHTIVFSPDNALVFKPTSVKEIAFYQSLNNHLALRPLLPFTPQFLGTLRLKAQGSEARESVVLTNVLEPFTHPSILDVKLGTVLYDDDAPEDKKERMKKVAEETTSGSCGLRLVGFSNWNSTTQSSTMTPKAYGKSLTPSTLPSGLALFFPSDTDTDSPSGEGPAASLLVPVLENVLLKLNELRSILAMTEARFIGSSVLIVYEADRAVLGKALKVEGGDGEGWFGGADGPEGEDDLHTANTPPSVQVKMIDFAHSTLALGQGPDRSVLKGLDGLIGLVLDRIDQVKHVSV